jgi:hypothetical protein
MNEHLQEVVSITEEYGLQPMIWSDMYFRLASKEGNYYDFDSTLLEEVKQLGSQKTKTSVAIHNTFSFCKLCCYFHVPIIFFYQTCADRFFFTRHVLIMLNIKASNSDQ